jgi:HK97 gp10 family phage protein
MSNSVRVEGLEGILSRLEGVTNPEQLKRNMGKACAFVERAAKEKAPKDTGALRGSITSKVEIDGVDVVGVVYTPLEYAPYVEYGTGLFAEKGGRADVPWSYQDDEGNWHSTSGQKPQPFMRPALDENRQAIVRILKEGITEND